MDKRNLERKRIRVTLNAEPGTIKAFTGDVSRGGLFIVTTRVLPIGTRVRLVIQTDEGTALGVGTVRWAKRVPRELIRDAKGGMGIEFVWVSPELKNFIEKHYA